MSEALERLILSRRTGLGSWLDAVTSPIKEETVEPLGFSLAQWLLQEELWTVSQETQGPAPVLPLPARVALGHSISQHFCFYP